MRNIYQTLLIIFLSTITLPSLAQNQQEMMKKVMAAILEKTIEKEPRYGVADDLAQKAILEVKAGNLQAANTLILESIDKYPVGRVFDYAEAVAQLPDIAGGNAIINKLLERVNSFPENKIYVHNKYTQSITEEEKGTAHYLFAVYAYYFNRAYADVSYIDKSAVLLEGLPLPKKFGSDLSSSMFDDFFGRMQYQAKLDQAVLHRKTDEGLAIIAQMQQKKMINDLSLPIVLSGFYLEIGDPAKAIEVGKKITKEYQSNILFQAYAEIGDVENALNAYKKLKNNIVKDGAKTTYYLALIDVHKKDYDAAITKLQSIKTRATDVISIYTQQSLWRIYTSLGDAYTAQKQFTKAKDNYDIALLYHPDFGPAIDGLSKLESITATIQASDKTPPVIVITEPSPNRGLKVTTAATNVMVKGTAKANSGLKEVTINGVKVYAQPGGDFWGDVPMVTGINKVTVIATDMAGNKAEKTFDIEKQEAPAVTAAEIVAVQEKEGKNYCLLIAAQNYADSSIPSLDNPIADAIKLKVVLKNKYNFTESNIITLFNPGNSDIKRQLLELTNTIQPEDNLVIFYAGHGIWVDKEKKGYWLMTDAKYKDVNTWLPNKDVLDLIAKLQSRHTLLITDACFSGSVFKTRGIKGDAPAALKEMDNKISRVAITSGNDTEVPDESVFMKYLVKALNDNKEQYLTAQKMFITQILEAVMTESKTEPRYGTLELAGHVGGDFIFSKK